MDNVTFFIQSFVAFFVIIDAIGNVPIFISLLEPFKEQDRKIVIKRAILIALLTLLVVTFTGNIIFGLLNIKMYSFNIAGGILLMIISIEMLFGRKTLTEKSGDMEEKKHDLTVTPLAIPLLTGPGAFTTGIVLFHTADTMANPTIKKALLIASILLAFLVSYWVLSKSHVVFKRLGKTGTKVVIRVMGLLLLSLAVQFIINGISEAVIEQIGNSTSIQTIIQGLTALANK
jgi:multiple antibiotic resistance protein